jgi:hypothetical protein
MLFAIPAAAQTTVQELQRSGNWRAVVVFSDGDLKYCGATSNSGNRGIDIWGSDVMLYLTFQHIDWSSPSRRVEVAVKIDQRVWQLSGDAGGRSVTMDLAAGGGTFLQDFMTAVKSGGTISLHNSAGNQLSQHSLRGSSSAVDTMLACIQTYFVESYDPF